MSFIWASRGKHWGFRFLHDGGIDRPLLEYEAVFEHLGDDVEGWQRMGDKVAVRFLDPLRRQDRAGRVIPHDFVLYGKLAEETASVENALERVWPLVAEEFAKIWESRVPPAK